MRRSALLTCVLIVALCGVAPAQQTKFAVTPDNQPKDGDPAETMKAYGELNQKLADATEEPASSCLKSYAVYQACKGGGATETCGTAPSCSATGALPQMDMSGMRIQNPGDQNEVVLVPTVEPQIKMLKMMPGSESSAHASGAGVATGVAVGAPPPAPVRIMQGNGTARIAGGVIAGNRVSFVPPMYPEVAKMARLSGTVVLRAIISKTGKVDDLQVMSATNAVFDTSAIEAVMQWRYRPYLLKGQPTEVDTTITVNYLLNPPTKAQPSDQEPPS
jgi:TonB family protein